MAQIKQVGIGRKSSGTIDGITYYTVNGKTFARSAPNMPASAYNSPEAKVRQTIFKMIQMHTRYHLRTIRQTISPKGNSSSSNIYISINYKALAKALETLAAQYCGGEVMTIADVEAAISAYAAEHPKAIIIASKSGYQEVYLEGEWPATITLNAQTGDSTVIIIVAENGTTTTINADGTTTVETGTNTNGGGTNTDGTDGTDNSGSGGTNTNGTNPTNGGGDNGGGGDAPLDEG